MRVLLTGGGTGGHLFPALAVAGALKRSQPAPEILFVGSVRGIEATTVPQEGYPFEALPAMPMPRRLGISLLRAGLSNLRSVLRARALLDSWKPDVIFATGGFASAPVLAAARLKRVPVILHEQNSVPGVTNRLASRFAREVHIAFSAARYRFPRRDHLRLSGSPIREGIVSGSRSKALRLFRLDNARRTVFIFGGSQGAHRINEAVLDALPYFSKRRDIQFVIQAGQKDYGWMLERCRSIPVRTWVRPFIVEMGDAYSIADLVVCRAGALTLAELAAAGKPAILIPYPHATADHQTLNAESAVETGAAELIADRDLNGERLAERIDDLIRRPNELRRMSIHALRLARTDATERIVAAIRRAGGDETDTSKSLAKKSNRRGTRERRGGHVAQ